MSDDDSGKQEEAAENSGEYCRHVEAYLCRKNDGHLIRIAGPAFSRVCGWADQGIPLNVVYRGIDRYFERYYARGPRRRPVQIEFCENDVLDLFEEWRRAVGVWTAGGRSERRSGTPEPARGSSDTPPGSNPAQPGLPPRPQDDDANFESAGRPRVSLSAHLERVIVRLTTLRAGGRLTPEADSTVAAAIRELDGARGRGAQARGAALKALVARLRSLDLELVATVRQSLGARGSEAIDRDAREQLAPFKSGMTEQDYQQAVAARTVRLLRERTGLPVVEFEA